jgi:hypothetical protein
MHKRLATAIVLSGLAISTAVAQDRLGVRPGMSLAAVEAVLKPRCETYTVSGDTDRAVTCRFDAKESGPVVDATVSAKDRTYYVAWRESADGEALDYAARIAAELGFGGAGKPCRFYDYEMLCWTGSDGTVLYSAECDPRGRFISYLVNETIEQEDSAE